MMGADFYLMEKKESLEFAKKIIKERAEFIEEQLKLASHFGKLKSYSVIEDEDPKELLRKIESIKENNKNLTIWKNGLRIHMPNYFHERGYEKNLLYVKLVIEYD